MSDTPDTPASPTPPNPGPDTNARRPCTGRRRGFKLLIAGTVVALLGAGAYAKFGPNRHGPFAMMSAMDSEAAARHLDKGVDRVLGRVDATADQKAKVGTILRAALKDLAPLRNDVAAVRGRLTEVLKADTIDRARLEQLRVEQTSLFETASRRMVTAMAETADVLTPAQRQKLIAAMEQRRRGWGWRG